MMVAHIDVSTQKFSQYSFEYGYTGTLLFPPLAVFIEDDSNASE
jgi:hypothetical protein